MFSSLYSFELLHLHFCHDVLSTVFFRVLDIKQDLSPEVCINFCLLDRRQRLGGALCKDQAKSEKWMLMNRAHGYFALHKIHNGRRNRRYFIQNFKNKSCRMNHILYLLCNNVGLTLIMSLKNGYTLDGTKSFLRNNCYPASRIIPLISWNLKFIVVFESACHLFIFWAIQIQFSSISFLEHTFQ
jgi:hypothetical protein